MLFITVFLLLWFDLANTSKQVSEVLTIALMMEAASTSETSVNFYQTTRRNNPKDSHLHTLRREKLNTHF
jgi:hypothetical protein